jgi:hypothetical protein
MVEDRENNLFFGFLQHHKGLTYNSPLFIRKKRVDAIGDLFFGYWTQLSDWERYALLEMMHSRGFLIVNNSWWTSSADKLYDEYYRRYKNINEGSLQQWMVDDLKKILISVGYGKKNRFTVPDAYEKWFIVPAYEKILKSTGEFQSRGSKKTVRKNGYRWDEYFPNRTVSKVLNALTAIENDRRKEEGLEPIEVDFSNEPHFTLFMEAEKDPRIRDTEEDLPFDKERVNENLYKEEPPYSPLEEYLETDKEIEGKRDTENDRIRDKEDREDDI